MAPLESFTVPDTLPTGEADKWAVAIRHAAANEHTFPNLDFIVTLFVDAVYPLHGRLRLPYC